MSVVRKGPKATGFKIATYLLLAVVAVVILFPFLTVLAGSIKPQQDTFTYPPSLFPHQDKQTVLDPAKGPVTLYTVPGKSGQYYLSEEGVSVGEYRDVSDATTKLFFTDSQVQPTGKKVKVDGQDRDEVTVTVAGKLRTLYQKRFTTAARFVNTVDAQDDSYLLKLDAHAAQEIKPRTKNFSEVLKLKGINRSVTNTVLVTVLVVAGQVITSILGGYAFSRLKFKGRDKLFMIYLGSAMIPFVVLIIPLYQLMVQLGWVDNLVSLVIPFVFTPYGTFLMRQFFSSIPKEIEEAALLDGASRSRILWRIMVPLAKPAIATLSTFGFLYAWNSFVWPLIVINSGSNENFVLPLALSVLGGRGADTPHLVYAGVMIAMLPPITVFILAQRAFVENQATSGLK